MGGMTMSMPPFMRYLVDVIGMLHLETGSDLRGKREAMCLRLFERGHYREIARPGHGGFAILCDECFKAPR